MKGKGGTISINWGEYGGFYFRKENFATRLCLGWIAFTYWPIDLDNMLDKLLNKDTA